MPTCDRRQYDPRCASKPRPKLPPKSKPRNTTYEEPVKEAKEQTKEIKAKKKPRVTQYEVPKAEPVVEPKKVKRNTSYEKPVGKPVEKTVKPRETRYEEPKTEPVVEKISKPRSTQYEEPVKESQRQVRQTHYEEPVRETVKEYRRTVYEKPIEVVEEPVKIPRRTQYETPKVSRNTRYETVKERKQRQTEYIDVEPIEEKISVPIDKPSQSIDWAKLANKIGVLAGVGLKFAAKAAWWTAKQTAKGSVILGKALTRKIIEIQEAKRLDAEIKKELPTPKQTVEKPDLGIPLPDLKSLKREVEKVPVDIDNRRSKVFETNHRSAEPIKERNS